MHGVQGWEWAALALGAFCVGLSKTGIAGLGILVVVIFASILPTRQSVGVLLPILISADVIAVTAFRRHADWGHLLRLFPWAAVGVVIGYFALGWMSNAQADKIIGGIVLVMTALHLLRQRGEAVRRRRRVAAAAETIEEEGETVTADEADAQPGPTASPWFVGSAGLLAGFTTMVANAAGPVMILYLLAMRLPKMAFIGTSAWYFLFLNLFKVPFSVHLGLIQLPTLPLIASLAPFAVAGALAGRVVLRFIPQTVFENLALIFTVLAGLRLVLKGVLF